MWFIFGLNNIDPEINDSKSLRVISPKPNGDIEIKIIGLRPGEKLYEELLIGDNPQKTSHSKILKTNDPFIPLEQLQKKIDNLKALLDTNKAEEVKIFLEKMLNSYQSNSEIVDHIHLEQLSMHKNKKNSPSREKGDNVVKIR